MGRLTLGTNQTALSVQRYQDRASSAVSSSFERLSSGLRINKASDDAAGLAVATTLRAHSRVLGQGIRNINDGISTINIADGALTELGSIALRLQELSSQAATGTLAAKQRIPIHNEAVALVSEFNRILQVTESNGVQLLDSSLEQMAIQFGYGSNEMVSSTIGSELAHTVGNGTFQAGVTYGFENFTTLVKPVDVNGDGNLDLVGAGFSHGGVNVMLGRGDGTFDARVVYANSSPGRDVAVGDVDGDGDLDLVASGSTSFAVFKNNGNVTFQAAVSTPTSGMTLSPVLADFTGDGKLDLVYQLDSTTKNILRVGNGDGTFGAATNIEPTLNVNANDVGAGDFNADGKMDLLVTGYNWTYAFVQLGNGDGTFQGRVSLDANFGAGDTYYSEIADLNNDGYLDVGIWETAGALVTHLSNGDGTFTYAGRRTTAAGVNSPSLSDMNGDGIIDLVSTGASAIYVHLGNGDGTFQTGVSSPADSTSIQSVAIGDFNEDGAVDAVTSSSGGGGAQILLANGTEATYLSYLDLSTQASSRASADIVSAAHTRILQERGSIGAFQSRLETALAVTRQLSDSYDEARSRIEDVDVATETVELTSAQVRQNAATAILATANQQASIVLGLIAL